MVIRPDRPARGVKLIAALFVAVLFAAACGDTADTGDSASGDATTTSTAGGVPATDAPGGEPGTPDDTTAPTSTGGATVPPTTSGGGSGSGPAPTTTQAPPPALGGVGGYAAFYLRPSESAAIVLDVHSQSGAEPAGETVSHLRSVLGDVSGKPVDLNGGTIAGSGRSWTADQIRALADRTGLGQSRDRSVMKLFFLNGDFAASDSVLGVAVRSDVAAVFSEKVDAAAGVLASPTRIETAVSTHEVGHLLGLVDLVLSTGRQDPEHPGHSTSRESVMYWAVESDLVGTILDGGPPTTFDAADRADLAKIRNG